MVVPASSVTDTCSSLGVCLVGVRNDTLLPPHRAITLHDEAQIVYLYCRESGGSQGTIRIESQ